MGEARRRGTLEQRVAQAAIRRQEEEVRTAAKRQEKAVVEARELRSAVEHREVIFRRASTEDRVMLASLLAMSLSAVRRR